jgi:dihydroorotate dehydrogenase (NAD+) catalytic subunit
MRDGAASPVSAAPELSVEIAGVRLPNPLVLASGILGTHSSLMLRTARCGAGAITAKSAGPVPRGGHVNPSCVDFGAGLLNAIGLANPGAAAEAALLAETRAALEPLGVPLIASIFADTVENFARVAEQVAVARPHLIEINISCPNVASEFGEPFAGQPDSAAAVTAAVKAAVGIPIIVKLAPNVPSIARIARAVADAGADAICAINTMPGMLIDIESGLPVLQNRSGGLSGPALKPIALYAVYQIRRAVDLPIIGTGGVESGADALEMILAGATAVGIGSAVYGRGPEVFGQIAGEMAAWLAARGLSLDEIRGGAHRQAEWPEPATPAPMPHVPAMPNAPAIPHQPAGSGAER